MNNKSGSLNPLRRATPLAVALGVVWGVIAVCTVAVAVAFASGDSLRPRLFQSAVLSAAVAAFAVFLPAPRRKTTVIPAAVIVSVVAVFTPLAPVVSAETGYAVRVIAAALFAVLFAPPLAGMIEKLAPGKISRHLMEDAIIRLLDAAGRLFFAAIVLIPFYVMVMTSLKSQHELLQNPLDFSIDLSEGVGLLRSYIELFRDFNFATYLWNSFYISVLTVVITLLFSVPGAYAVARLRFRGQKTFARSILLIYMVPTIVLALPIYIAFSALELRNTIQGLVIIYPVTTIPVALYLLQGYFRGLPYEVEEAGLMDGLSRLQVIRKITLPLSLPAMVSVSLYVFMIAWNEFLLAFMLLDDPARFTLTRGVASLNSSEVPRTHLMAGAVIATVPIMALFLALERFIARGLAAGAVKG
ncbi:MAG: carbohydrate ABC transporter permease [Alphaproteobacteria bacterium]|nr:carbohydrate ABC transporter permease [Alphaproteobacteria bacterium]MDA8004487.1 carbohydrate ABC transporter permease [Alphaproteobacteria bacterium]MDA8005485.1 carbohydrate ABC transporter permease [Alphaproteobacteria bacterium]MDA8013759.1 carbohydrate ABC transporter permease [Alphaproteobacteria bacterium]